MDEVDRLAEMERQRRVREAEQKVNIVINIRNELLGVVI